MPDPRADDTQKPVDLALADEVERDLRGLLAGGYPSDGPQVDLHRRVIARLRALSGAVPTISEEREQEMLRAAESVCESIGESTAFYKGVEWADAHPVADEPQKNNQGP
jgi:hypothetical protein